jgi:hypothetical protein
MYVLELGAKPLILLLLWLLLSSPFLAAAFFTVKAIKRRGVRSPVAILLFGLTVALLIAPVPTPIITVFIPNGLAIFDKTFYASIFSTDDFFGQLRSSVIASLVVTSIVCTFAALRYVRGSARTSAVSEQSDA